LENVTFFLTEVLATYLLKAFLLQILLLVNLVYTDFQEDFKTKLGSLRQSSVTILQRKICKNVCSK